MYQMYFISLIIPGRTSPIVNDCARQNITVNGLYFTVLAPNVLRSYIVVWKRRNTHFCDRLRLYIVVYDTTIYDRNTFGAKTARHDHLRAYTV